MQTTVDVLASLLAVSGQSALQLVFPVGGGQQLVLRAYGGEAAQAIVQEGRPNGSSSH